MRTWVYTWKSSDGLRHEGEMSAPNKDAVYVALREKGIRAIKVTERIQPIVKKGFKGLRKRELVFLMLCSLSLAGFAWYMAVRSATQKDEAVLTTRMIEQTNKQSISSGVIQLAQPRPRKWLDLPVGFSPTNVFTHPHEIYLSRYALPGVTPRVALDTSYTELPVQDFYDNLNAGIVIDASDDLAVAELKRIVAGMKEDAKKYLTMPDGIKKLGMWLDERQTMEASYREQYALRVQRGELTKDDVNAIFSAMGLELLK